MLKLRSGYVAIAPIDEPDTTPGGIIIPDSAKDRTKQGIVKYVGPNCSYVEPLDYVIYGGYDGKLLMVEGEGRLIIVHEDYISAKVSELEDNHFQIPDVYFKTRHGYIEATYEALINFIIAGIRQTAWYKDTRKWFVRDVTDKSPAKSKHRVMADSRD